MYEYEDATWTDVKKPKVVPTKVANGISEVIDEFPESRRSTKVKGKLGEEINKVIFAVLVWIASFYLLFFTGITFIDMFYGAMIASMIWVFLAGFTAKWFLVSVSEVTGLATINIPSGYMHSYGPGMHFKYPFEQVKKGNFITQRVVREEFDEEFLTKDGPKVKIKWSMQYRSTVAGLPEYISVDAKTIKKGFGDLGNSYLTKRIVGFTAKEAKEKENIISLEKGLIDLFKKSDEAVEKGVKHSLEMDYGIDLFTMALFDSGYEQRYQDAITSKRISKEVAEIAEDYQRPIGKGGRGLSPKDALNAALVINGKVSKNIVETEGEGGQALASLLIAMGQGGKTISMIGGGK